MRIMLSRTWFLRKDTNLRWGRWVWCGDYWRILRLKWANWENSVTNELLFWTRRPTNSPPPPRRPRITLLTYTGEYCQWFKKISAGFRLWRQFRRIRCLRMICCFGSFVRVLVSFLGRKNVRLWLMSISNDVCCKKHIRSTNPTKLTSYPKSAPLKSATPSNSNTWTASASACPTFTPE
jgi:hypothetical protein